MLYGDFIVEYIVTRQWLNHLSAEKNKQFKLLGFVMLNIHV